MIDIAYVSKDVKYLNTAKLKLSFVLLSAGFYKETCDSLNSITIQKSDTALRAEYYVLLGRYYYDIVA